MSEIGLEKRKKDPKMLAIIDITNPNIKKRFKLTSA